MTRDEWLAARRGGIGGSDIAALLGMSKWRTPLALWLDKTSDEPANDDDQSEIQEWGHRLEPVLVRKFSEQHPLKMLQPHGEEVVAHPEHPWMLASLDGTVYQDGSLAVWEAKTVDAHAAAEWADDATPDAYVLQVQWYMAVTGYADAYISALIGGNRYVERHIERDDALIDTLITRAQAWWNRHVVDGEMPAPTHEDGALLNQLWQHLDTDPIDLTADTAAILDDLRSVRAQIKTLGVYEDRLKADIKLALAEHTEGYVDGRLAVTWRTSKPRTTFDTKAFAVDQPDLHAKYLRESKPVRTLLLKDTT